MMRLAVLPELQACVAEVLVQLPQRNTRPAWDDYRVLPGPYPVLGCQYRGRLAVVKDGSPHRLFPAGVTGLQPEARWFRPEPETYSILVRLTPAGAVSLLGVDMDSLAGAHVGLDEVGRSREASDLHEQISQATSIIDAAHRLQQFLSERLARAVRRPHPAVVESTNNILSSGGNVRIASLTADAGISERQLERLFRLEVGVSPKEFASLCRFDWVMKNLAKNRPWADLALAAGYSDQAHFIRSFARRAGLTPARFASELKIR